MTQLYVLAKNVMGVGTKSVNDVGVDGAMRQNLKHRP